MSKHAQLINFVKIKILDDIVKVEFTYKIYVNFAPLILGRDANSQNFFCVGA